MKKKMIALCLTVAMAVSLTACGTKDNGTANAGQNSDFSVAMATNVGGVNDQSFCQSAWEGLTNLKNNTGAKVSYLESLQESDYTTNLDKLVDADNNLVWAVGFAMSSQAKNAALTNPDVQFGIIDETYGDETPDNMVTVMFRAQEPSFLVGYIAGLTTKTDKVGFVGGIGSAILDQFEYGYRAGVAYAANELGKDISVTVQYAESFIDAAKGKAIATKMYNDGCDIVFHAAGTIGVAVIEAAKESGNWAIGVDMDQYHVAPEAVLTSAVKRVDRAIEMVSKDYMDGIEHGGENLEYGLSDGAVGIPEENPNVAPEVLEKTAEIEKKIVSGDISVPYNQATFSEFAAQ